MARMYLCMWMVTEESGPVKKDDPHIGSMDMSHFQGEGQGTLVTETDPMLQKAQKRRGFEGLTNRGWAQLRWKASKMDRPRITPGETPVSFTGDTGEPETWNILLLCLTSVFSVSLPQMSPGICCTP